MLRVPRCTIGVSPAMQEIFSERDGKPPVPGTTVERVIQSKGVVHSADIAQRSEH